MTPLAPSHDPRAGTLPIGPSLTVHDGSTITTPDPEYPFILGTMQGHAAGGSILAAAAEVASTLGITTGALLGSAGAQ